MDPGFNQDAGLIKLVAMVTMLIDHLGVVFFGYIPELRIIGRIAFPLFCWGIVMGLEHTRSVTRYALRILVMGLVSQPFYMLALTHSWYELNVMATLLLGLASIVSIRAKWYGSQCWGPLICLMLAAAFRMDYGWQGVLLIILMHLARRSRGGLAALMVAYCLYWGTGYSPVTQLFGLGIKPTVANPKLSNIINFIFSFIRLQGLAILALPFILIPTRSGIRIPKWLSYGMYPGHLLILWLITLL